MSEVSLNDVLSASLADMSAKEVSLDGKTQWGAPSVSGQIDRPDSWNMDELETRVYDMSNEDDVEAYQSLVSDYYKEDPVRVIVEQDRKFCKDIANWKIFVVSAKIVYKKLTGVSK